MCSHTREGPRLPVLIALSALAVLPINMFVPSLPSIARDLEAEFALVNVAVAGYAIATAFVSALFIARAEKEKAGPAENFS